MSDNDTRRVTLVLVLIVAGALLALPLLAATVGMMGAGPMMGESGMWGGGLWEGGPMPGWLFVAGVVMQLLFLFALVGGGYLVYRRATEDRRDLEDPPEELRLAYARGDLADEEYEQRRERLERDT